MPTRTLKEIESSNKEKLKTSPLIRNRLNNTTIVGFKKTSINKLEVNSTMKKIDNAPSVSHPVEHAADPKRNDDSVERKVEYVGNEKPSTIKISDIVECIGNVTSALEQTKTNIENLQKQLNQQQQLFQGLLVQKATYEKLIN